MATSHVLSGQEPAALTVASVASVEIGEREGEPEYLFESIPYGRILPDGRIVVADVGQLVIRLFSPEGSFLREVGGRGGGPGEFAAINGLWLTSDDRIRVWDSSSRRITTFRSDGSLEGTVRVVPGSEMASGNLEVFLGAFEDGDIVLASLHLGEVGSGTAPVVDPWILGRFGESGTFEALVGELRGFRRVGRQPLPFTPRPHVAIHGDSLYVVDGVEPRIVVLDKNGTRRRNISVRIVGSEAEEDAWAQFEQELRRRDRRLFVELLETVPRDQPIPTVGGLLIDERGLLWVKEYDPLLDSIWLNGALRSGAGGEWRVISRTGEFASSVQIPSDLVPLDIRSDELLGVRRDELDIERVVIHRVVRTIR